MTTGDRDIRRHVPAGTEIFREGDVGFCAYIIESGRVQVSTEKNGETVVLAHREVGDIFGEMAIVDRKPRSATITAIADCELLVVSEEQLAYRLQTLDPILKMVFGVILERFRESISQAQPFASVDLPCDVAAPGSDAVERVSLYRQAIERIELEQELRVALREKQFELHFQPLMASRTGRLGGLEALIRWRHPKRGLLPPGAFIAAMEQSGLIHDVSRWLVEECCRAIKLVEQRGTSDPEFVIAINVTTQDIADPAFRRHVRETIEAFRIEPARLTLEITESQLMDDSSDVIGLMQEYRDMGVGLSIDDFGTGYSSLSYLTRYPVTGLKIDKSFVDELHPNKPGEEVIRAMIGLGHGLGMKIVAEGVETLEQAMLLRRLGCDRLQGFYFSKPVPLADAIALMERWQVESALPDEDSDAFAAAMESLSRAAAF